MLLLPAVLLDKNRKASRCLPSYNVALSLTLNLGLGFYSAWFPSHWLRRPKPPSCQVNRVRNLQSIHQEFRSQLRERLLGTRSWNPARNLRIRDVFRTRRISRAGSKDGSWWSRFGCTVMRTILFPGWMSRFELYRAQSFQNTVLYITA